MNFVSTLGKLTLLALTISLMTGMAYDDGKLDPVVRDEQVSTIEAQLKRYQGQTQFLTASPRNFRMLERAASLESAAPEGGGAAPREQQESDIFKVGKTGSKLLFLLNNNRGLQVVSYAKSADLAQLIGRVEQTGNYPNDMYYDAGKDRLIVLENLWYDSANETYTGDQQQSRVIVYDVSNPKDPKITEELKLEGEVADSRMVGSVLYVATSVRANSYYSQYNDGEDQKGKGYVYSLGLSGNSLSVVAQTTLTLPVSSRENMNIVEVFSNGVYNYYLVAVLSQSGWGWWDRQSAVEVVDISNPNGQAKSLMVVSAKGWINKRSQTMIKDNTLIVSSNYNIERTVGGRSVARVAVETFKLPDANSEILTQKQAEFRKVNIDQQLEGLGADESEALYKTLVNDPKLGLNGRFVRKDSTLEKMVADFSTTLGDTTGLSANLQDVRYDGNLMYLFWVPQNNIDPFELFDISAPQNGAKYLGRLQFDGWIEHAIPVRFHDKPYVLGLGWLIENVDNERQKRYPQAMLFEITNTSRGPRALDVAQLTLRNANVWAQLNGQDKFIEFKNNGDGTGVVMFTVSDYSNGYKTGGKLLNVDLNQLDSGKVFTEGKFLAGDSGWMRRVFSNPEISRVNAFSDKSLATFDANRSAEAIHVLELSRNIAAYVSLNNGSANRGIQIVNDDSNWWGAGKTAKSFVRVVDSTRADAEKDAVLSEAVLEGSYLSHLVDSATGRLLVLTQYYKTVRPQGQTYDSYQVIQVVHSLKLSANDKLDQKSLVLPTASNTNRRWYYNLGTQLLQLPSGQILVTDGGSINLISADVTGSESLSLAGCKVTEDASPQLSLLGQELVLTTKVPEKYPNHDEIRVTRNFIATVSVKGNVATCGQAINIPGTPLARIGAVLVTNDVRTLDLKPTANEQQDGSSAVTFSLSTAKTLAAVKIESDQKAHLTDEYEAAKLSEESIYKVGSKNLVYFENVENQDRYPYYLREGRRPTQSSNETRLVVLTTDTDGRFVQTNYALDLSLPGTAQISGVLADPQDSGRYLIFANSSRNLQVLSAPVEKDVVGRPEVLQLVPVDTHFNKKAKVTMVTLPGWVYSYGRSNLINFSAAQRSIEIPLGNNGVSQIYLAR